MWFRPGVRQFGLRRRLFCDSGSVPLLVDSDYRGLLCFKAQYGGSTQWCCDDDGDCVSDGSGQHVFFGDADVLHPYFIGSPWIVGFADDDEDLSDGWS